MTCKPSFSIITVCQNHRKGLEKTHKSVQIQTLKDFEWIVIDGGSTDTSLDFLKQNKPDHFISEPDNGPYDAMNKGIAQSNRQYIIFLNAGDMLAGKDTLQIIAEHLSGSPDFLYGDGLNQIGARHRYKKARSHKKAILGMFTHHQAMIYKAQLLENLRYDTRFKIAADYDLTLRFIENCKTIAYIRRPICIFESGGISQKQAKLGRREQRKIRRELKLCSPLANNLIMIAQKIVWQLRRSMPSLYWLSKRASRH